MSAILWIVLVAVGGFAALVFVLTLTAAAIAGLLGLLSAIGDYDRRPIEETYDDPDRYRDDRGQLFPTSIGD